MTRTLADRVDDALPCNCVPDGSPEATEHNSTIYFECQVLLRPTVLALLVELREECALEALFRYPDAGDFIEIADRIRRIGEP